ncbi:MAG: RusA family crossover junction endodeoxyribonuclease, partial [Patescibacteria group bacterium]|nr:RusA family crossover junction endodeoxyribonuclease [Patescibacteria group bacterium]
LVTSEEGRAYKHHAQRVAIAASLRPMYGELSLIIDFYRPLKSGDLDNRIKPVLDALSGIAYEDDSQVVSMLPRRFDDKANPRAEVTIIAGMIPLPEFEGREA